MLMTRFARTAAAVLMLAGVLWASPVGAEDEPDCDPKQRACMSESARTCQSYPQRRPAAAVDEHLQGGADHHVHGAGPERQAARDEVRKCRSLSW